MLLGRAPLRISFGGGGTDLPEVFEKYGGAVISASINRYVHCAVERLAVNRVNRVIVNDSYPDDFTLAVLKKVDPTSGLRIYYWNDVPPGRGLGSSSAYSVLLIRMIKELEGTPVSDHDLVSTAFGIESEVGRCGWQDQYATALGGFNYMSFSADRRIVYPLRIKYSTISRLEESLLFANVYRIDESYKAQQRNNYDEVAPGLIDNANSIRDCLLSGDISLLPELLNKGWKQKVLAGASNHTVDFFYNNARRLGALGGKLLGAGNGGCLMLFVPPEKRKIVSKYLVDNGLTIESFQFSDKGVETWTIKN